MLKEEAEPIKRRWTQGPVSQDRTDKLKRLARELYPDQARSRWRDTRLQLSGEALKKKAKQKHTSAAGPDGWAARHLSKLPKEWWDKVAEVVETAETA